MRQSGEHPELVRHIISSTRWALVLRSAAQAFSWMVSIVVVRFISPADYGLNAMLQAPLELMMLLSTMGLDAALVRFANIERRELQSAFGWLLVFNGLLFGAYFLGGATLASYFGEPELEHLAKALAWVFLLAPFRIIPNALLDRALEFRLVASAELVANVLAAITTLALAIVGLGVWALVWGVLANRSILALVLMIRQPWIIVPRLGIAPLRRMIAFSSNVSIYRALTLLIERLASLVAGPALGATRLGIYNVAMEFALLPLSKTMPIINPVMFPAFSKLQDEPEVAGHYLAKTLAIIALVLFPAMAGLACVAPDFVPAVLGEQWLAASLPLALLCATMPFRAVTSVVRPVMMGMGRIDLTLQSALWMLVILSPLLFVGLQFGVIGLAVAWTVAEPIVALITLALGKRVVRISFRAVYHSLRPAIAATLTMSACVLWAGLALGPLNSWAKLAIEVAIGATTYCTILRLFFPEPLHSAYALMRGRANPR